MEFNKSIELLRKYLSGNASPEEIKAVEQWYASFEEKHTEDKSWKKNLPVVKEQIYHRLLDELNMPMLRVPLYKKLSFLLTAAAILILFLSGSYFLFFKPEKNKAEVLTGAHKLKNDIAPPVSNKATLTLADGSKIELDSSVNGTLAVQGKINVVKQNDGLITYQGAATDEIIYNTLTVPKGSKPMKLLLADGSEVWLNVASSITYPTAFAGNERKVEITGEAYFEIAKNKAKPFIVEKKYDNVQIQVTGTHFNVKAYDDEIITRITLLEGSVDVLKNGGHKTLRPGEQAAVSSEETISVVNGADLEEVMAWKNGRFYFDGADIKTIMRQVEKWYDVDVSYEDDIPYSFVAKISRNVNASELFKIFQLTELVHFRIEGNKITVMK